MPVQSQDSPPDRQPDPIEPVRTSARRTFIEQGAVTLGKAWAEGWRHELHAEGRAAAGGWPGTMGEARARVSSTLMREMLRRRMATITAVEREFAARTAYATARSEWRRNCEPEAP